MNLTGFILGIYQNLFFKNKNTEEKMKYLCFMYIYEKIYNKSDIYAVFNLKDTQNRIENWDMSYKSIRDMVKFIEKGNRIYELKKLILRVLNLLILYHLN